MAHPAQQAQMLAEKLHFLHPRLFAVPLVLLG
jgi:hypothetical protein